MLQRLIPSVVVLLAIATAYPYGAADTGPRLSLWYRGQPPGIAKAADLAAIRAAGFTAITWPSVQTSSLAEAARLAAEAGLDFIVRSAPVPLTTATARHPDVAVDIVTARMPSSELPPLVWRAIAHGARDVSFDPGVTGARLLTQRGLQPAWSPAVGEISRQLRINGRLFAQAAPAADQPKIDGPISKGVDIVLLNAGRSWVLVATNTSATRAHVTAHLPAGVPYAIWLNLLNGDTLAMLSERPGPRWSFDQEPWGTRIYVIDKELK